MCAAISSDSDLPDCLNETSKQFTKARELVSLHCGPVKAVRGPQIQGFFSRTMIVTPQAGDEMVIQFRLGRLDLRPFALAREKFGSKVPEIKVLQDQDLESEGVWAYWMTCIPGKTWLEGAARLK